MSTDKDKPSVAILLAAYNGSKWIQEQISTLLYQKNINISIFISVDKSDDGTYKLCKKIAKINHSIKILSYGKVYGGAARNFFRLIRDVDFSNFDYISLSDQDDIWGNTKLFHAITILKYKNVEAYSGDVEAFWKSGKRKIVKKSYPQKEYDYLFESAAPGCSYVLKSQSFQQFKVFLIKNWDRVNLIESHDWLIYAFFRSQKMSWYIDSKPLMLYRQHESNQVGSNFGLSAYLMRIRMIKSGWYRSEVERILEMTSINNDSKFNLEKWFLIKNFYQLRRQNRDAFILLIMILSGVF